MEDTEGQNPSYLPQATQVGGEEGQNSKLAF